jgi:sugar transferase (PEP-CTERM/EpsH1 system associated)
VRILVLTQRVPFAPNRGDRIRAYHLIRLLETIHHVRIVSLVHDQQEHARLEEMRNNGQAVAGAPVATLSNYAAAFASLPTSRPLTHSLLHGRGMEGLLERELEMCPDVVVAYGTGMMQYAFSAALKAVPCLLDMVDVDSEKWEQLAKATLPPMTWVYRREARLLRAFERSALRRAHVTTVVSERERELARSVLGEPAPVVVPNGVDVGGFAPRRPACPSNRVVFSGVFNYQPNEDAAVWLATEVWPLVRASVPDAVLQLVGMKPSRRVRTLATAGAIEVTGEVADVRPYLWSAAAAAAPLFIARGIQNKVLEALASGLPCVVTTAVWQGLPEVARPACVARDDAVGFAASLVRLLQMTPIQRRVMSKQARLTDLSWPSQLEPMLALLEAAAASGKALR